MSNRFQTWLASQKQTRKFHPSWIVLLVIVTFAVAGVIWMSTEQVKKEISETEGQQAVDTLDLSNNAGQLSAAELANAQAAYADVTQDHLTSPEKAGTSLHGAEFAPPDRESIPAGEFGDAVRLGRNIFNDTQTYARAYVGNGLKCVNCHLDEGRKADSAPLWAAYGMFPAYREKNHKVNSFEDRLSGCFRYSMNGKAPAPGSKELIALVSYSFWLAKGAPTGVELAGRGYPKLAAPPQTPDVTRGNTVFEANCRICHGADGQGTQVKGRYVFPPLWGKNSFNAGAGMSKDSNAAGFIKANMPLGQGDTLSVQEAWDVAKFMSSHTRPPDPRTLKQ